jgi:hypothetical protein
MAQIESGCSIQSVPFYFQCVVLAIKLCRCHFIEFNHVNMVVCLPINTMVINQVNGYQIKKYTLV